MIATTTMTLQAILRAFFFLNVIVLFDGRPNISQSGWDKSTTSVFHSELESDQIIYTRIVIPRNANKILIKIFATTVADEAKLKIDSAANRTEPKVSSNTGVLPRVLLKYNGLPTFDDSDAYFQLPKSPMFLEIIDDQPYESELYIGLWGGYLLHSFRYFAGSPTVYSTGVPQFLLQLIFHHNH